MREASRIVLASSSPRRAAYLRKLGYRFRAVPSHADERRLANEGPRRYVRRVALMKSEQISGRYPEQWVIAADTTVTLQGAILGKPENRPDATRMLRRMSGKWHRVLTSLVLARRASSCCEAIVSSTRVRFRRLGRREIEAYVSTEEPFGKAGAYAIQGVGGLLIQRIEGSYSNVVGFPIEAFYELAGRVGFPLPSPFDQLPRRTSGARSN